jgi:glutamate synthase (NADPH/NADH) small chain
VGKVTGFLEIERRDRGYEKPEARLKTWTEFVRPLGGTDIRDQAARCMNCGIPYCHNGCPVNNIIPDWNHLVYEDDWRSALEVLHSTNNFPEFTGRVCPAPCEAACTLNIDDAPVTIKTIECQIVDRGWAEGWIVPQPPKEKTGKRVAVVGSGPAGLACAQQLARAGHAVTVFEKNDRVGGLLRYGIPTDAPSRWRPRASNSAPIARSASPSRWKRCARISTRSCLPAARSTPARSIFPDRSCRASATRWSS